MVYRSNSVHLTPEDAGKITSSVTRHEEDDGTPFWNWQLRVNYVIVMELYTHDLDQLVDIAENLYGFVIGPMDEEPHAPQHMAVPTPCDTKA